MISVSGLSRSFGSQTLFRDVSLQFNPGERYGLVGANGSGKSTFLRILSGDDGPSEGTLSIPKRTRIGVLKQDHFSNDHIPILDVVMMGNAELWSAMEEKERLLANAEVEFDADRYSEVEEVILNNDGYSLEARAGEILEGLGIPTEVHRQELKTLSGGFRLRVLLAQVLAAEPDVLLLDEPTNHLDILSIRWLEKFLESYPGCALIVSHDHRFLDNVCTWIADVDYETILLYKGNYRKFEQAKVDERERKEAAIAKQEAKIAEHKAFVDRFRAKATKARQAQSKLKAIDKIDVEILAQSSRRYPRFRFEQVRPSGKRVVSAEGISKAYGEKKVLDNVSIEVERGDRLAILGPNGIGKSTLLKILVGNVEADAGEVEWGYETHFGYFAQDHREQLGNSAQTVESWLWDHCPSEPIGFVRGNLGNVLFSGDEADKKIRSLSGGEAARLILCRFVVEKPNVLLLDEPTNHLDLEAIDALVEALKSYDGTLVFVSHDRWFVQKLATRILEITPKGMQDFRGGYDEYLEKCGDDHLDADKVVLKARREKRSRKKANASDTAPAEATRERKKLSSKLDKITHEVEKVESRVHEINEIFCDPGFFESSSPKEVQKLEREQKNLNDRSSQLMGEWEELEEQLAALDA